jgi:hypothetical protein
MGYDLAAHIPNIAPEDPRQVIGTEDLSAEFAHLRMGAHSGDAAHVFAALDASSYDGKVSGTGIGRCFSAEEVNEGLRRLCALYAAGITSARTVRFVAEVAERAAYEPWVYIDFG